MTKRETPEDLANQRTLAAVFAEEKRCDMVEMPENYVADYMAVRRGKPLGWVEMKNGNARYSMSFFKSKGGYKFSLRKFLELKHLSLDTGLPVVLVLGASDGIWFLKLHGDNFTYDSLIPLFGREDRGGKGNDIEPCGCFDTDRFTLLREHQTEAAA